MTKHLPAELPDEKRGELLLYQAEGDGPRLEVRLYDESVWLSLNQMAELFQVDKSGISRHLKNIFQTGELPQLLQNLQQLPRTTKPIKSNTSIWTPLFL